MAVPAPPIARPRLRPPLAGGRRCDARPRAATDPGSWELSPEWMGTDGGGYGRTSGAVVTASASGAGNGPRVRVTAHPSTAAPASEWRVLRFGDTRQSVALVDETGCVREGSVVCGGGDHEKTAARLDPLLPPLSRADPRALAFEYVKSVVSVSLALLAAARNPSPRILCVGVGGGSIPHALAAALPAATVTGVELDPVVLDCLPAMGLATPPRNLTLCAGDGAAAVAAAAAAGGPPWLDLVVVDAFDGADRVPAGLTEAGGTFLSDLASALDPDAGAAVVNLHCGPPKGVVASLGAMLGVTAAGPRFDASTAAGSSALAAARAYGDAVAGPARDRGTAFVLTARRQQNAVAVAVRGGPASAVSLAAAGAAAGAAARLPFDAGDRASYGFWEV